MKAVRLYLNKFNNVKIKSVEDLTPDEYITLFKTAIREIKEKQEKDNDNKEVNIYTGGQENEPQKKISENVT